MLHLAPAAVTSIAFTPSNLDCRIVSITMSLKSYLLRVFSVEWFAERQGFQMAAPLAVTENKLSFSPAATSSHLKPPGAVWLETASPAQTLSQTRKKPRALCGPLSIEHVQV